ncbi:MAG: hypothetical protein ACQ5SW_02385 [Sphaerochaetaceae bacterium]
MTASLVGGYEQRGIRGEFALHASPYQFITALQSENRTKELKELFVVYKGQIIQQFTPWKHHALYGGIGGICYAEHYRGDYMIAFGPSLQYVWRIPNTSWELKLGMILPLVSKHTYESEPDNDLPSSESFAAILLIMESPSIAIHYRF